MALLLHVPVLHRGYFDFFSRHPQETELYIIGETLINEFPLLTRDVRRMTPEEAVTSISSRNLFEKIEIVEAAQLASLADKKIISADEAELQELIEKYLPNADVVFDTTFLRWDAKSIRRNEEVKADVQVTEEELHNELMALAIKEASKSADWFRQVGAVIWKDGKLLVASYNKRQPNSYEVYAVGDPRNYVELGEDTHLRQVLHAEQGTVALAARYGLATEGASVYVTTFPCPDCAALLKEAGIATCYFREGYSHLGGAEILKQAGIRLIKVS
jgi:dCMP deaminase